MCLYLHPSYYLCSDASAQALMEWRAHSDRCAEMNKQLTEDLTVARRLHQAAATDRDGLEQRVRQLKTTIKYVCG